MGGWRGPRTEGPPLVSWDRGTEFWGLQRPQPAASTCPPGPAKARTAQDARGKHWHPTGSCPPGPSVQGLRPAGPWGMAKAFSWRGTSHRPGPWQLGLGIPLGPVPRPWSRAGTGQLEVPMRRNRVQSRMSLKPVPRLTLPASPSNPVPPTPTVLQRCLRKGCSLEPRLHPWPSHSGARGRAGLLL